MLSYFCLIHINRYIEMIDIYIDLDHMCTGYHFYTHPGMHGESSKVFPGRPSSFLYFTFELDNFVESHETFVKIEIVVNMIFGIVVAHLLLSTTLRDKLSYLI